MAAWLEDQMNNLQHSYFEILSSFANQYFLLFYLDKIKYDGLTFLLLAPLPLTPFTKNAGYASVCVDLLVLILLIFFISFLESIDFHKFRSIINNHI